MATPDYPTLAPGQSRGYCPNCGSAFQPGDKFCAECGAARGSELNEQSATLKDTIVGPQGEAAIAVHQEAPARNAQVVHEIWERRSWWQRAIVKAVVLGLAVGGALFLINLANGRLADAQWGPVVLFVMFPAVVVLAALVATPLFLVTEWRASAARAGGPISQPLIRTESRRTFMPKGGISAVTNARKRGLSWPTLGYFWPAMLVIAGSYYLLNTAGHLNWLRSEYLWPALLIVVGGRYLLRQR